ncbi:cytosine-purine permease [Cryphonectria parasitica EP155]|uniref:Cytosine-purine permease n=1 Tax=Cryphonectria parasitica (strain ATCC 38755 / EP155) TaxID=660469 RepID=A0A9P5CNV5_CRYP1|nr:cytosine-purine permease [Cryphonectria parasitica EP155]KAF3764526.1 cytosine-purine permease [Cryphonectria parasitica EP155]
MEYTTRISENELTKVQRFVGKFGVEKRGIERVPSHERTDTSMSKIGTLWMSANMTVSSFAIGALAQPVFKLGFVDTALTVVFFNFLGILPVCFFSTFGPKFGLRQMVLSRFFFGYYGVKLIALFNVLACLGWSAVNVIVGAQLLAAINPETPLPGWAGILIISLSTLLITTFGYRLVHAYERWSWLPVFIIFLIVAAEFGRSGRFHSLLPLSRGPAEAGSVLSFAASVYGYATGWTSMAADYTVYQPETASRRRIFWWTFAGLLVPLVFTELLGAAIMTAATDNADGQGTNDSFLAAYSATGIGGILAAVLVPPLGAFGRFCLAVLALSTVANNCPNIYSVALSLQVLTRSARRVPRALWTLLGTCAYVAVAVPGYGRFESWLEDFMLLIGYWLAIYQGVALTEHLVFRVCCGGRGYENGACDAETPGRLPPGMAAVTAFGIGVVGAVLGMAQAWWTGPVGRLCGGGLGGDVGFELAFGMSAVSYVVLRSVERAWYGR